MTTATTTSPTTPPTTPTKNTSWTSPIITKGKSAAAGKQLFTPATPYHKGSPRPFAELFGSPHKESPANSKTREVFLRAYPSTPVISSPSPSIQLSPTGLPLPDFNFSSPVETNSATHLPLKSPSVVPPNSLILAPKQKSPPQATPIERERIIKIRKQGVDKMHDPVRKQVIQHLLKLNQQTSFVHQGITYEKGASLGKGQFVEAFATNRPGVVLKLIHEDAIWTDLYANPWKYWIEVEANYAIGQAMQLPNGQNPFVKTLNMSTLKKDCFALQEAVVPLDNLTQEQLDSLGNAQIFPQIKQIIATIMKHQALIEFHRKNLGVDLATGRVLVYDLDRRAAFGKEGEDLANGLAYNLKENLASYGSAADYLDPRQTK